mgnify:CR=1 FL=1
MQRRALWQLLAVAIIVLLALSMVADAKKAASKADKQAKSSKSKGKEASKSAKPAAQRKYKDLKDWSKISESEWAKLEDDWMEDEEEDPGEKELAVCALTCLRAQTMNRSSGSVTRMAVVVHLTDVVQRQKWVRQRLLQDAMSHRDFQVSRR